MASATEASLLNKFNMKLYFLLFILNLLLTSCIGKVAKTHMDADLETVKVDFDKEYNKKKFPHTNSSITIQKLEENSDFPIGKIDKIIVDSKRIYILDRSKSKALFIYSREGQFLHIINHIGRGPGEFITPHYFDVDKKTGNIFIMDNNGKKIIIYSSSGKFIKEFEYNFIAVDFVLDNEKKLLFNTGGFPSGDDEEALLIKTDEDGHILNRFFSSESLAPSLAAFNSRNSLQECGNRIFYLPTLSNYIYSLDNDEPQKAYRIDFGKDWPTEDFFEKANGVHPLKVRQKLFESGYVCFLNFIQTKDILHLDFNRGKNYSFYYNKVTKQSLLLPMEDDSVSFPVGVFNDQFIFASYKDTGEPFLVFYDVDFNI